MLGLVLGGKGVKGGQACVNGENGSTGIRGLGKGEGSGGHYYEF